MSVGKISPVVAVWICNADFKAVEEARESSVLM